MSTRVFVQVASPVFLCTHTAPSISIDHNQHQTSKPYERCVGYGIGLDIIKRSLYNDQTR